MYCDQCGTELQAGQRYCGSCGKPVGLAVVPATSEGRVGRHITLLAVLWLAASALNLIGAAVLFFIGTAFFGHIVRITEPFMMQGFLHGLFTALAGLLFLKAMAGFAAGWGLLERQPWARPLTLVLAFISLINIPFGTALGIYSIWVLLSRQSDEEYRQLARAA
jgi:hypothetical protein